MRGKDGEMINEHELMVWTAGLVEGCGAIIVGEELGPTGNKYASITIVIKVMRPTQVERLMKVVNNGEIVVNEGWVLSGSAAVSGFLKTIWTWLSPDGKTYANEQIRRFKELQQKLAS